MPRSNEDVVRGWFLEVWNKERPELMSEFFAEDGIAHGLGEYGAVVRGPREYIPRVGFGSTSSPSQFI